MTATGNFVHTATLQGEHREASLHFIDKTRVCSFVASSCTTAVRGWANHYGLVTRHSANQSYLVVAAVGYRRAADVVRVRLGLLFYRLVVNTATETTDTKED